jgi:molybdenum cofactor cytidylyltransferase
MGRDKALLPLGQHTFLEHLASMLAGEVDPLLIVLGHHAELIERQVRLPPAAKILYNPEYALGQLSSLHVALRALDKSPIDGVIVCLVDHPAISKQVLRIVRDRILQSHAAILIPTWRGRRGHPVLFSSRLFQELLDTPLDQGARAVVRRHSAEVELVAVEDEGIVWDVDRPEDYAALQSRADLFSRDASERSGERS